MSLLLGIDFGTSGVRLSAYDPDQGRFVGTTEAPYPTVHPHPGWAEQSPEDWWQAFLAAGRALVRALPHRQVLALGVATTASTVVVARADGTPLRPALLWMDARAEAEARFTGTIAHPVLRFSGGADAVEWLVPKAMWLRRHEPAVYHAAERIVEAIDFINFRLTGEWTGSQLNATCKWNYDPTLPGFHGELFEAFGVPELIGKLPLRIVPVGGLVGRLRVEVAAELGLEGQPLVAQGGIDAHVAMLGAATLDEGELLITGGTSVVHLTHARTGRSLGGIWGPYPDALLEGRWLLEGGQVSGGSVLSWLAERIFGLDDAGHGRLIEEAAGVPPGASGVLTLDYWMGNRTPYRDARLRGAVLGLSLHHDRAALYRSAVESIALGTRNAVDAFTSQGVPLQRVVVAGGIRKNRLWLETLVDVLDQPVHLTANPNLSLVAGVVTAATVLGLYPSLEAASRAMVRDERTLEPRGGGRREVYAERLEQYRAATESLTPVLHALSRAEGARFGPA